MLGVTTDDRSGSMGRFPGELLEFSGLAPEVRGFTPESHLQFRDFGTRLLECLLPFTGIAKPRFELRSEVPSLLPKGLDFSGHLLATLLGHRGQPSIELASLCFALQPERQFLDLLSELIEFPRDSTTRTSSPS
jgi:hypothetical protein